MSFQSFYTPEKYVYSLEFFPPKPHQSLEDTLNVVKRMSLLEPDYMTVTYGAAGGTRENTKSITSYIAREMHIPAVAHLTCVGHTAQEIDTLLDELKEAGIKHILALRGDPPHGEQTFVQPEGGFECARDLAKHIKARGDFSVAVAGYPEVHPDAKSEATDLEYLRDKIDAGGEIVITQLFFEPSLYSSFVTKAKAIGITAPIVPGIMPISNVNQLKRFTSLCGASIPDPLLAELEKIADDKKKVVEFGTEYALSLCHQLLEAGAPGIHFYTLNRCGQVEQVLRKLPRSR